MLRKLRHHPLILIFLSIIVSAYVYICFELKSHNRVTSDVESRPKVRVRTHELIQLKLESTLCHYSQKIVSQGKKK